MRNFLKTKPLLNENGVFSSLADCEFPVYISKDLNPLFSPDAGNNPHKAVVTTIPKSGTYLVSAILLHAGFELVKLNVRRNSFRDFRWKDLNDVTNLENKLPLEILVKMIIPGQVIAGHIQCDNYTKNTLLNFKKIFVYRNMRDALVSAMRHAEKWAIIASEREILQKMNDGPEKLLLYMKSTTCKHFVTTSNYVIGWLEDSDTFKISYEEIMGDFGKEKQKEVLIQLFKFLDYRINKEQIETILNLTFDSETLTKTEKRTNIEKFWNNDVGNEFVKLGFEKLNSKLGF